MHHSTYGLLYDYLKPHEKEVDRERILRAQIAPPTHPENQQLALYAQQSYPPQQATQPTASVTPNDQSQQPQQNQLVPYNNNNDQALHSQTNEESDPFEALQQGFVMIANAFSRYTNKSNNRIRSSSNT